MNEWARKSRDPSADAVRVPPHSVEAEQAVLGGLMLDNSSWDAVGDRITADDFYRRDHQLIFGAISDLAGRGEPCDAVTLSEFLDRQGTLGDTGGLVYLATLARDTPSAANVRAYAQIVRERSQLRHLIRVGGEIAASVFDNEGQAASALVDEAERRVFEIAESGRKTGTGFVALKDVLGATIDRLDMLHQSQGALTGVSSGFTDLDRMTAGLQAGDLVVVAGRPSMGKTTLALNMAENAAIGKGVPVAVFSMEMSREQLAFRMISSLGRVNQSHLRTGLFGDEEWSRINGAISLMKTAPIYIDDTGALTPTEVRARARRLKREHGLGLIVIDYLQLMQVAGNKENRATEISEISRSMKALAKELKVPVIALSQLNRGVEQRVDKKPVMSDLRECVTGDTLVWLANGRRVPIRNLVGQTPEVLSMDVDGKIIRAKSDAVWSVGVKPVFEISLASGRKIRTTGKHRLYTSFGWQRLDDLGTGDRLAIARTIPEPEDVEIWPDDRVALLAHLIGDGSYLKQQPMRYTTGSEECSALVRRAAETEFGMRVTRYAGRGNWHQLLLSGNGNRWKPAGINLWLRALGVFGQRSAEKRVPEAVFRLSNEQVCLFLRHLWVTDGTISTRKNGQRGSHSIHFATCSRGLSEDVAALLLRVGIVARIQTVSSGYKNPMYMVSIRGVEPQSRFMQIVGAFGPRVRQAEVLQAALGGIRSNPNVDTVPYEMSDRVIFLMQQRGVSKAQMAALPGYSSIVLGRATSRAVIGRFGELLADQYLVKASVSDLFWDRILTVEEKGEEEVFDLTVPGPASWLADGIVNHNSGAIEQDADLIVLIYREEVYDPNTTRKGIADIIIAKQRNGPTGEVHLTFLGEFTKFENLASDSYGQYS